MKDVNRLSRFGGTASLILTSFLLFYFPSVLAIVNHDHEPMGWLIMSVTMAMFYTVVFYLNYFWLVPSMLIKVDRKALFFITNFCIIVLICSLVPIWFETHGGMPGPKHHRMASMTIGQHLMGYLRFVIRDGVMMVLSAGLAYALRISREREKMRRQELELDSERRQIELQSLKAQLNPHFLFNTLNNIYALIGFDQERAQSALHDLSSMLRFMIYESSAPFVPLGKDLQFIREYIDLMRLRLNPGVKLESEITDNPPSGLETAPLLFLTLVENAFKHSGAGTAGNFIRISISVKNDSLVCHVENSVSEDNAKDDVRHSGIGLSNVKRQLGLLYPGNYDFEIRNSEGIFSACIRIKTEAMRSA